MAKTRAAASVAKRSSAKPHRIGVLISGRGSNMVSLAKAVRSAQFPAEIVAVVSNVANAPGLDRAAALGLETDTVAHRDYATKAAFEAALDAALKRAKVDVVCLAGFMRVLSPHFVGRWQGRILNIHPSLLPSFPGLDAAAQAIAAGVKIHGATVHVVTPDLDAGPIVAQAAVRVAEGDTEQSLSARLIKVEHRLYPQALRRFLETIDAQPPVGRSAAKPKSAQRPETAQRPNTAPSETRPGTPLYSPPLSTL